MTTSFNGTNRGYQHYIDGKIYLGSAASFVPNQRLTYKLVDRQHRHKVTDFPDPYEQEKGKAIYNFYTPEQDKHKLKISSKFVHNKNAQPGTMRKKLNTLKFTRRTPRLCKETFTLQNIPTSNTTIFQNEKVRKSLVSWQFVFLLLFLHIGVCHAINFYVWFAKSKHKIQNKNIGHCHQKDNLILISKGISLKNHQCKLSSTLSKSIERKPYGCFQTQSFSWSGSMPLVIQFFFLIIHATGLISFIKPFQHIAP